MTHLKLLVFFVAAIISGTSSASHYKIDTQLLVHLKQARKTPGKKISIGRGRTVHFMKNTFFSKALDKKSGFLIEDLGRGQQNILAVDRQGAPQFHARISADGGVHYVGRSLIWDSAGDRQATFRNALGAGTISDGKVQHPDPFFAQVTILEMRDHLNEFQLSAKGETGLYRKADEK